MPGLFDYWSTVNVGEVAQPGAPKASYITVRSQSRGCFTYLPSSIDRARVVFLERTGRRTMSYARTLLPFGGQHQAILVGRHWSRVRQHSGSWRRSIVAHAGSARRLSTEVHEMQVDESRLRQA